VRYANILHKSHWKKGDKVIVPPPKSLDELNARLAEEPVKDRLVFG
jgi:hypothetical protein